MRQAMAFGSYMKPMEAMDKKKSFQVIGSHY